jgi:nitrogen fixation NifU-like protein
MTDDWKNLYNKAQPHDVASRHSGPLLFYNELVIDHMTNPRNIGGVEHPDGVATIGDPSCGDYAKICIKVHNNRITDVKFTSNGCQGAIATISMMTELAKGKTLEEAQVLTDDEVITALGGVPEKRKQCSLMGVTGLQEAIKDYLKKQNGR